MKAVVKTRPEPGFVEVIDVPIPKIKSDEVLVKIKSTGICGTDILLADWRYTGRYPVKPPIILGHEGAGEVVEVGGNVRGLKPGDRVGLEALLGCGQCHYCRRGYINLCPNWDHLGISFDGTFAEYIAFPAKGTHVLPQSISFDQGAFLEPISIVAQAMETNPVAVDDTVVIVGPGPLGLFTLQAAKAAGAAKVIMIGTSSDEKRLQIAKNLGADYVVDLGNTDAYKLVKDLTDGIGADVVFEAGGTTGAVEQAILMAHGAGKVFLLGFATEARINPLVQIVRQNLTIKGVVGSLPLHYETAIRWLENDTIRIEPMVGDHVFGLDQANRGFELMKEKQAGKVLFRIE
ncbi:alcohol dehydrogenase catalytic domain-containing protein [Fodinisporobacter ferrooxydans]|uniref:Alcohol dehydrogenase catalytic domain-containing protein n=1 Tax=Fodinisporobacter ferrooxydans TaxID=2901836 RepID=A0ABY4CL51_9BACL|nr:alcohol dehydrogenase catalytic domain-containing protein [Alicyclobacillaceae bacterium MYW30-H2]